MPSIPPINISIPTIPDFRVPTAAERARAEYLGNDFAGDILRKLIAQVRAFEAQISDEEEIGIAIQTTSGFEQVAVERIRALPPDMLIFSGLDVDGNRVALVQHASQTNVLFRAIRKRAEVAQRIGFDIAAPK